MDIPSIRTDSLPDKPYGPESDACAIYLSVRKFGQSTFGTLKRSIGALINMGHRTGFVNGEGDGAGIQTDIPRRLWARKLSQANLRAALTSHPGFYVGHLFVPTDIDTPELHDRIQAVFEHSGLNLMYQEPGRTRPQALGGLARHAPPAFWQLAGAAGLPDLEKRLLEVQVVLESEFPIHFLSLSSYTVVYKLRGSVETLSHYYPDLQDRSYDTAVVLCHARYSTNTVSNFERSQPFALLGHNGEINTINRLRLEAEQAGVILPRNGSDSQDVDRTIHTLCANRGLDLVEAMETVFPPVPHEVESLPPEQRAVYTRIRQSFGPYAQGPAAILARYGDTIVASVDALGLRPLWFVETEKEYIFSSERGAIPMEVVVVEPRPLGPGEKMAIHLQRGAESEILDHAGIRRHVMNRAFQREAPQLARQYWTAWEQAAGGPFHNHPHLAGSEIPRREPELAEVPPPAPAGPVIPPCWLDPTCQAPLETDVLAASGWNRDHQGDIDDMVFNEKEVGSLGFDGPLAVLSRKRVNVADFFKETVAVVTNPAIDRGREAEVFSTSSLFGASPEIGKAPDPNDVLVILKVPILTGGHPETGSPETAQAVAEKVGTLSIEQLLETFAGRTSFLILGVQPGEDIPAALERLATEAVAAVQAGAQCLVLDDTLTLSQGLDWLDPMLAVSRVDEAVRRAGVEQKLNLRRKAGLVVHSAAIRGLHDIALLSGFGADAINPYAMLAVVTKRAVERHQNNGQSAETAQLRLVSGLKAGLEKITSTMGCHELRGYGRVFSSIGLAPSVAAVLKTPNYFGSETAGLTWERLGRESAERGRELRHETSACSLEHIDHFYPKLWKKVGLFTRSVTGYDEVLETFRDL
ncbi:MAG TPA: glutamate synthase central domain-containing protein, partial [Polyangia bacterium]